jgi:hypothetical protein
MLSDIMKQGGTFLKGRFTYAISLITLAWAIFGVAMGYIDIDTASVLITGSLTAMGIRRNMPEVENVRTRTKE